MRRGSRKLEGECTDFGYGAVHEFWMVRGARSARLGGGFASRIYFVRCARSTRTPSNAADRRFLPP